MSEPSIFEYLDYRAYLRDWYRARKARDPRFSRRQFARRAGRSSPGFLTEVMDGNRQLTPPTVQAVAQALDLSRTESEFFAALVDLQQASDTPARNHAWDRLSATRSARTKTLDGSGFEYLSNWWYPVVRELAHRADFRADPAWVARRVRPTITEAQARRALECLQALGLLEEVDGRIRPVDAVVTTPHEVEGLAVHNYHLGMLDRAREAIDRFEPGERHLVAATISVPTALVPRLKQEINALQERILALASEEPAEQVLQIELLMFPLSDRAEENPS
ncbi:MAG: TIGR02147 family protein [Myxococcota bacterium]